MARVYLGYESLGNSWSVVFTLSLALVALFAFPTAGYVGRILRRNSDIPPLGIQIIRSYDESDVEVEYEV